MSTGLHSAQDAVDVVHQRLRKTVSDISSSLRPPPPSQDLPRSATMDQSPTLLARKGAGTLVAVPQEEVLPPRRSTVEDKKYLPSHEEHPARRKPPEEPHKRYPQPTEETRKKPPLEEVGRKSTIDETTRRPLEEDQRLSHPEDRLRPQQTPTLARAQALYKSASKGSVGETELKVRVGW